MRCLERSDSLSISLSNHRCEEIKKTVVKLFVNYEVSCVPVSGFELATRMGVEIIPKHKNLFKGVPV